MDLNQNRTKYRDVNENDISHLAGLFDGAGTHLIEIAKRDGYKVGYMYRPLIKIQLPLWDDVTVGKLDAFCEEQKVEFYITEEGGSRYFEITGPENIRGFLTPLYSFIVTKHEPTTIMLDGVVPAMENGEHRTKDGFIQLVEYSDQLREYREAGSRDVKYDKEYFEDEWPEAVR